ncbi:unnamed protein product [Linum trigynum]|uniref:Uncharacterized protein n=1 Tax=Linum trigynum TaxID=586398 RepID=A0AAV2CEE4_9ROSI
MGREIGTAQGRGRLLPPAAMRREGRVGCLTAEEERGEVGSAKWRGRERKIRNFRLLINSFLTLILTYK